MVKSGIVIAMFLGLMLIPQNKPEGWEMFSTVKFYPKYFEEIDEELATPQFDKIVRALEGSEITLSGYYIPLELDSAFMLSALPYSSCFFCGGAGPETVAEIQIYPTPKYLAPDAFIKVKGKLKLNDSDLGHMNFILQDAKVFK